MSRKTVVEVTDDIDGGKADESITFALDGTSYEIDLSKKNAAKFRGALAPYLKAAQKVGWGRAGRVAGRRSAAGPIDRGQNRAIRAWAEQKGLTVARAAASPRTSSTSITHRFDADGR